jgi:hypothetical protein
VEINKWTEINLDLANYNNKANDPSLQNVTKLNFIISGLAVGEVATFYIKNITFYSQNYVFR